MDPCTAAAREIAGLFPDAGARLLAEAGRPETWEEALAGLPPAVLVLPPGGSGSSAERLLSRVRDYWSQKGDLRGAAAATRALLDRRTEQLGPEHPDVLVEVGALGALAARAGRTSEAAELLTRAWQGLRSVAGGRDLRLAVVAANLALHHVRSGRLDQAETLLESAYRIRKELAPATAGVVAAQLGELKLKRDRAAEAVPLLREAWEAHRQQLGADHPRTVDRGRALCGVLRALDRYGEGEPVLRDRYEEARRTGDPERVHAAGFELGVALDAAKREEGFRLVEEAVRWTRQAGDPHPQLPPRLSIWYRLVLRRGLPEQAEGVLMEALEAERRLFGEDSAQVAVRYATLGQFLVRRGRSQEALGWLDVAVSLLKTARGLDDAYTRAAVAELVPLMIEEAKVLKRPAPDLSRDLLEKATDLVEQTLGFDHPLVRRIEAVGYR